MNWASGKLLGIQERDEILAKLKERVYETAPKLYLAIDILSFYNKLRPGDLRTIKEGDIDLGIRYHDRLAANKKKKEASAQGDPVCGSCLITLRKSSA